MQQVARKLSGNEALTLVFNDSPLPTNTAVSTTYSPAAATMLYMVIFFISAGFLGFWMVYMTKREDSWFHLVLMMKGATPLTYFLANFFVEV